MKKRLLSWFVICLIFAGNAFAVTVTKGLIGEQDIKHYDGTGTNTFTRITSSGASLTLNKVGYEVDVLDVYGAGVSYTDATITSALTAIGTSTECTIVLKPGTWTIDENIDWSSYTNVTFKFPRGAILTHSTYSVTLPPNIDAGDYQIFSGAGTIAGLKESNPYWFGAKIDNATDDSAAWQAAFDSIPKTGGVVHAPVGTSYIATGIIWPNDGSTAYAIRLLGNNAAFHAGAVASTQGGVSAIRYGGTGNMFDMRGGTDDTLNWYGSIENVSLWGNETATTTALYIYGMRHAKLSNVVIRTFGGYGIKTAFYTYYSQIQSVRCSYCGIGWYGENVQLNGTVIENSMFTASTTYGIEFINASGMVSLKGCWFEGNGGKSVRVNNASIVSISDSWFENNSDIDVFIDSTSRRKTIYNASGNVHYHTNGASTYALHLSGVTRFNSIGCLYWKYYPSNKNVISLAGTIPKGIMSGNTWPDYASVVPFNAHYYSNFIWDDKFPSITMGKSPALFSDNISPNSIILNTNYNTYGGALGWSFDSTGGAGASASLTGITATTTAASTTVTVNATTGITPGCVISIAGETFGSKSYVGVLRIDSDTSIIISTAADTGVSTAAVSYYTAKYKTISGLIYDKSTSASSTSGTGEDTLSTLTIPAGMMTTTSGFKVTAAGTKTGGNGNKTIKFYFGANAITVFPATNNVLDWQFEAQVFNYGGVTTAQIVVWKFTSTNDVAGESTVYGGVNGISTTTANAVTMKLTGECAHADDVITLGLWLVEPM